ncbi:DUF4998 domain-containing protein [Chondrinema litorale]|uniref:DUF4998 domain-containing protein n=1 Tax=Chondrinema litorale TaxID=2994555 RepID=UPI0025429516|nr:DUF4998 domain-containing protein [Chondrinema litorale]UZR98127.1 DUF4998 domain-containing protein [Chondrinema litorale]
MKNYKIFNKIKLSIFAVSCLVFSLFSCSEWDSFKEYIEGGEILYPGKMKSVEIIPGKNRVQLTGILSADPNVVKYKAFWNSNEDSVEFNIDKGSGETYIENTFEVIEGVHSFEIYTYDEAGNISVPTNAVGSSFGEAYRRKLGNRLFTDLIFNETNTTINWAQIDASTGAEYTEIIYTVGDSTYTIQTPVTETTTVLEGLTKSTTIQYRTIFKPTSNSLDTFAVAFQEYEVKVVPQLKNSKVPFAASAISGRWGTLADWQSNENVQSHDGFGGWDEWNGNIFNVESGWGAPPITNGKIWQTFTLEPATYTFKISELRDTNLTDADQTYLVAAVGDSLPNVAEVNTAMGSVQVFNRPVTELSFDFTVTETQQVSIGYLTTQPDGTPGKFCNIIAFDFGLKEE